MEKRKGTEDKVSTFRVMDTHGNTINFVQVSPTERIGNTLEEVIARRQYEATTIRDRWVNLDYFHDEKLIVVGCDSQGIPIREVG
jgi:hypothetical protein